MTRKSSAEYQELWLNRILEQEKSGLSKCQWCSQNNLSIDAFYYWNKKLFPEKSSLIKKQPSFTEIPKNQTLVLEYQGIRLRVEKYGHSIRFFLDLNKLMSQSEAYESIQQHFQIPELQLSL